MNYKEHVDQALGLIAKSAGLDPVFAASISPKAGMMKVKCAWCKADMGEKMGPDGLVSHGICKTCAETSEDDRQWEMEIYGRCLTAEERRRSDDIPFKARPLTVELAEEAGK